MSQTGGKRKVNKSLKAWVAFVKKVQREEKLSYKDAIRRAKERKDKGEKWMTGGQVDEVEEDQVDMTPDGVVAEDSVVMEDGEMNGGRTRSRTMRRTRGRSMRRTRGRTMRRTRGRSMRRSRGRARSRTASMY